ncbi:RIP metalloprotease RseP [Vaginella massiliensis]|uniref:RIP metalloprotease RseP n=1 Tax=Vaginella massiliensis TaxID=1816680 RepID=UPI0037514499
MAIQIAQLMLSLMLLVMLHEWGHYVTAKWFGVRVERFFIFFDWKFALWKKKIGDTIYGIGWLPLGGYVKLAGMIDESMDTEQMKRDPQPWEFRTKPAWQRLIIMLGGIIVNILLAIVIFWGLLMKNGESYLDVNKMEYGIITDSIHQNTGLKTGDIPIGVNGIKYDNLAEITKEAMLDGESLQVLRDGKEISLAIDKEFSKKIIESKGAFFTPDFPFVIDSVTEKSAAETAGVLKGDKVVGIDGRTIHTRGELDQWLSNYKGKSFPLTVDRNGDEVELMATLDKTGKLGVITTPETTYLASLANTREMGALESMKAAVNKTFGSVFTQVRGIKTIATMEGGRKQISGPIGMVNQMPTSWNWTFFWSFTAVISAWLAFVNLLPIPALDGGHAVFALYEIITGRKPSDKFLEYAQMAGFIIILGLMIFIFGNDILNLFNK